MARKKPVLLGEQFDKFIKSEIQAGRYRSTSEILRVGLRLLEDEKRKILAINEALIVGENSGEEKQFDNEDFKLKMRRKIAKNV